MTTVHNNVVRYPGCRRVFVFFSFFITLTRYRRCVKNNHVASVGIRANATRPIIMCVNSFATESESIRYDMILPVWKPNVATRRGPPPIRGRCLRSRCTAAAVTRARACGYSVRISIVGSFSDHKIDFVFETSIKHDDYIPSCSTHFPVCQTWNSNTPIDYLLKKIKYITRFRSTSVFREWRISVA